MQLPNDAMLRRRIQAIEADGHIDASVARTLVQENQPDDPNPANKIWFCFFPLMSGTKVESHRCCGTGVAKLSIIHTTAIAYVGRFGKPRRSLPR